MTAQTVPGKAVNGVLKVARFPADRLLKIAPENRATASAGLAIDRADAAVRNAAGTVLSDSELREDAQRRRQATAERMRAQQLRAEAEVRVDSAEARTESKQEEAEARSKKADEEAKRKAARAKKQRDEKKAQAERSAEKRKEAARTKAAKTEEKVEARGKVDRLEQLEKKSDALKVKEEAVRAADEARRLEGAATKAKQRRKSGSD